VGDEKKKGGKEGGTAFKLLALLVLALIGAEVASRVTGRAEWSPLIFVQKLVKGQT